ncbi:MAG: hypothetical protein RL226_881, partial [Bacteroidota bacterium]
MNLTFEYPNWLLLVCLVFAILFAGWMYRKDRLNGHLAPWLRGLLGVVRLVAMFLISLFLLHPLLKTILREVEAPIVVVAVDNSESMLSAADSNAVRTLVAQRLPELVEQLSADFEVVTYHFGAQLYEGSDSLAFTEKV